MKVRDTIIETELATLTAHPDSALEAMFSGRWEIDYKIDRDPQAFQYMLRYLKGEKVYPTAELEEELDYWGIYIPSKVLADILESEPKGISTAAFKKW